MQLDRGEVSVKAVAGIIGFCVILIVGFYTQIAIPIKGIEMGIEQLKITLSTHDASEKEIKVELEMLEKRVAIDESRLKLIESILKIK
jgi:hypothetical protein